MSITTDIEESGQFPRSEDDARFEGELPAQRPRLVEVIRDIEQLILDSEQTIENERRMPEAITDALYEGGVYKAFMPKELGGLEVHPVEWLEAVEEASRLNGSVGWLLMLHTGATWGKPETMKRILENERWIIAGNLGRASGFARKVEGGYRFTGRWPFASGSPEATYLYGRSILQDENGETVKSPRDGLPLYLTAYFPAEYVTLHDTWDGLGLRGTGSGDISVDDVFVPRDMVNESGIWSHPYPSPHQHANFSLAAHAGHAIGLAVAAVEEYKKAVMQRARQGSFRQARMGKEQFGNVAVGRADAQIRAARLFMQDVNSRAFEEAHHGIHIPYETRVLMHESNVYVVDVCRQVVDSLFKEMGTAGVFRGTRMERIFRDMMTAAEHIIVRETSFEISGQYWLTHDSAEGPAIDIELSWVRGPHPQTESMWKS
jgi:alkylation response protein AidB-like acyl-CoA dehydrogenase